MSSNYKDLFEKLTVSINNFLDEVKNKKSTLMSTPEWSVKDELCHIVFWHETYAANYQALAENKEPPLPDEMSTINARGVNSLRNNSIKELITKLQKAHNSLYVCIVEKKIPQMKYSKKGRIYNTDEFLEMIARHIGTHTKQVRRAK